MSVSIDSKKEHGCDEPKKKVRHNKWSSFEDRLLLDIVSSRPRRSINWKEVSAKIPNRNPRQCQERWDYYLSPDVNNTPWTFEEDMLLIEKQREFGTKWSIIATFFKGRTNTNVKNRYLALCRCEKKPLDFHQEKVLLPSITTFTFRLPAFSMLNFPAVNVA